MKRRLGVGLVFLVALGLFAVAFAQTTGVNDQEVQRFVLPGSNTTGWRAHTSNSAMSLRLPTGDIAAEGGYKVPYVFAHSDYLVSGVTSSAAPVAGTVRASTSGSGVPYQRAPYAGRIIGVTLSARSAITSQAAHAEATIMNSSDALRRTGLRAVIGASLTNTQYGVGTQARATAHSFLATDRLGCDLTTDSAITPIQNELVCTVVVVY